jgi:BlaI family transcriptional regulator, penicillinase repressor
MPSDPMHRLGDLQLCIMQALWEKGPLGVADVQQATGDHLAYTTIATMLRKMENRNLVRHRELGRRFIYEAAVSEQEITRSMANRLVDRVFEGSLAQTVSHLLETRDIDLDELKQLEQIIQARKEQTL